MLQHIRKPFVAFSALAAVLAMTGCQASGGGTVPSACGPSRAPATFGFTFQSTEAQGPGFVGSFAGTFRDPGACGFRGGVAMRGTGHPVAPDSPLGPPTAGAAGAILVNYESMNPANPGVGQFALQVTDSGTPGLGAGDSFTIIVFDGPYAGYFNAGTVQQGNITVLQGGDPVLPTP